MNETNNKKLSIQELAHLFSEKMGWGDFTKTNSSKNIFNFLINASNECQENHIVVDISAGEERYKPFFQHTQYLSIDSCVGDNTWDFSHLDLVGESFYLPFANESVDICCNFTSLEHYHSPHLFFNEVARILKPGGKLFLYVPCAIHEHQIPHDYFRYTRYALAKFCHDSNLKIGYLKPTNGIFETAIDILGQAIAAVPDPNLQEELSQIGKKLAPLFGKLDNEPDVYVDYPQSSPYPQLPNTYYLCAFKEGELSQSYIYNSSKELLREITACPSCHSSLIWEEEKVICTECKKEFPIVGNQPNFMLG